MLSKIRTMTLVAAASATFSAGAIAASYVEVHVAPPPPRHEYLPPARAGYVWVPGFWDWRAHRYVWVMGHWERERLGYVYHHPRWEHEGDHWRFSRGGWDRDHDGVPDRLDRHPDNPRRP